MSHESWSEWFIYEIKKDLREKMTDLEEVWELMILTPDKKAIFDSAARIAKVSIHNRDKEIARLEESLGCKDQYIVHLEEQLETLQRLKHVERHLECQQMAPTISDLTQTTIDQHKEIESR